jgi:4-amino-4-deoxy-L-arabinose transferase-like glycosyltransferase
MSRSLLISLLIISLAAGLTLWYVTPAGIGLTNDSVAYIAGARSILAGTGYSDIWLDSSLEALTHYPPLLSLTLAGIGALGLDPQRGARLLNILLFAANTGLMGLLSWRMTKSQLFSILLALLFALSAPLLTIHAYALSEPLFLFFSFLAFIFFGFAMDEKKEERGKKNLSSFFFLCGLAASLATLARYSGLALVATFLLSTFLLAPTWGEKFKKSAIFLAGVIPPLAAWFIRNRLVAESATNRSFVFHPVLAEKIPTATYNMSQWLMPIESWRRELLKSGIMEWILILLGAGLLLWVISRAWTFFFRPASASPEPIAFTTAVYIFGYLGAVLFSMSFFDASTKFQPRILSPLYVSLMVLFVFILNSLTTKGAKDIKGILNKNFVYFVSFVVVAIALGFSTFDFRLSTQELRDAAGLGYGSWKWRDAEVMAELKKLSPEVAIYTNSPPAVYFVTGRASRVIPTSLNPVDNQARGNYEQDLAAMRAEILAGRAVLALFDTSAVDDSPGGDNQNEYISGLKLILKAQGDVLYGKP